LACLRSEDSYIFAGNSDLDLALILDILNRELGVKRLLLEGGGGANGAFLRAGLVDELHLILCPAVDGAKGAPSIFDSADEEADCRAPVVSMTLENGRTFGKAAPCCCSTGFRTRRLTRWPPDKGPACHNHLLTTLSSSAR
jgi:riboflavin biosynthesis pyrimidine reductase